jgi:hypothetical protein
LTLQFPYCPRAHHPINDVDRKSERQQRQGGQACAAPRPRPKLPHQWNLGDFGTAGNLDWASSCPWFPAHPKKSYKHQSLSKIFFLDCDQFAGAEEITSISIRPVERLSEDASASMHCHKDGRGT